MFVTHRVGNDIVTEPVYKIIASQLPDGGTDFKVETEDVELVEKDQVLIFMTEEDTVRHFNDLVDPGVVLKMIADVMPKEDTSEEAIKLQAEELEEHLNDVIEQLKKVFGNR